MIKLVNFLTFHDVPNDDVLSFLGKGKPSADTLAAREAMASSFILN